MVTKIYFKDIKDKNPLDAIQYIQKLDKGLVKDVLTKDLLNEAALNKPFADTYYSELFPRGIYLFFNENDIIRYVGETNSGFFGRLMTHMDVTPMGAWAGNIMLVKMGVERTKKHFLDLIEADYEVDWATAKNYKLVLIEISHDELNKKELKWLEKVIMKAFKEVFGQQLLNTHIGRLHNSDWEKTIEYLVTE